MNVETRRKIEEEIARQLITDGIAAGYTIAVHNGEEQFAKSTDVDALVKEMFSVDEEHLIFYKDGKRFGWVWMVYGNSGYDVVADYTTNLEPIMEKVDVLSNKYCDMMV